MKSMHAPNFAVITQVSDADKWPMDRPHAPTVSVMAPLVIL